MARHSSEQDAEQTVRIPITPPAVPTQRRGGPESPPQGFPRRPTRQPDRPAPPAAPVRGGHRQHHPGYDDRSQPGRPYRADAVRPAPAHPDGRRAPAPPSEPGPTRSNPLATAGFVVALIGAVLSLVPVVGTVSWAISPIGLVLSAVGLFLAFRRRRGRGLAIAGVVLGVVGIVMCAVYTASFVHAVGTSVDDSNAAHAVTYRVSTAHGAHVSATYDQSQGGAVASGSVIDVPSPWSVDTRVSGYLGPSVSASITPDLDHPNRSDTVTCTIVEDGRQTQTHSATGANASVTCGP